MWNKVPQNLLTLSPGQWMELAFHPLAQHVEERSVGIDDVNDLILKRHLVDYYRGFPNASDRGPACAPTSASSASSRTRRGSC